MQTRKSSKRTRNDDLDRATRVNMQRLLCLACAFLALLPHTSSSPNQPHEDESTDTSIRPWVPGASSVEDDPAFMALVDKLAAEPISPDEKAALLHKYEQADEDTRVLIYTSILMEQTEPALRCSACEAAIGEVQLAMMATLKEAASREPLAPHWTSYWFDMLIDAKLQLLEGLFNAELCSDRMKSYGLHTASNAYVPFRLGARLVPGVTATDAITEMLVNQCRYLAFAFKGPIVRKLGNDTARVNRQIVRAGRSLETQLQPLWHAVRKEACNSLTRAEGACYTQRHPFSARSTDSPTVGEINPARRNIEL